MLLILLFSLFDLPSISIGWSSIVGEIDDGAVVIDVSVAKVVVVVAEDAVVWASDASEPLREWTQTSSISFPGILIIAGTRLWRGLDGNFKGLGGRGGGLISSSSFNSLFSKSSFFGVGLSLSLGWPSEGSLNKR